MSETWWLALGLVLILEGLMPLLIPNRWRKVLLSLAQQPASQLRRIGGALVVAGAVIAWWFSGQ